MTKDEFITGYMERSDLDSAWRTEKGYTIPGGNPQIALPCSCGEEGCFGWQMISQELAEFNARRSLI